MRSRSSADRLADQRLGAGAVNIALRERGHVSPPLAVPRRQASPAPTMPFPPFRSNRRRRPDSAGRVTGGRRTRPGSAAAFAAAGPPRDRSPAPPPRPCAPTTSIRTWARPALRKPSTSAARGRQIDDARRQPGAAIDHDDGDVAVVGEIGDQEMGAERQGAMGGDQAAGISGMGVIGRLPHPARLRLRYHQKNTRKGLKIALCNANSCLGSASLPGSLNAAICVTYASKKRPP